MNVYDLIKKKRDGLNLTPAEIDFLVAGYVNDEIPDYQFAAFLMAVYFRGMKPEEIWALTRSMVESGTVLDLSALPGMKIDKHSTGGVGDKVSIVLAPLAAACEVKVPMISGRGLGHTGGTLDKLESIRGFRTDLSIREFIKNLSAIGVAITGQSAEMVPADKKIYRLRDVTATTDSIPLIAASIMSKKLAAGISGLVLDVKTGSGAFMPTRARELARTMIAIGKKTGKKVRALITDMDQPLGRAVGNGLEIAEAIDCLKGTGPDDVMAVTYALGAEMLVMGKKATNLSEAIKRLTGAIGDGSALEKFRSLVKLQGGDERIVDNPAFLPKARFESAVKAKKSGWVSKIEMAKIGRLLIELGGGRKKIGEPIDPAVGFIFEKKIGERVDRGEVLAKLFANDESLADPIQSELAESFTIGPFKPKPRKLILGRLG